MPKPRQRVRLEDGLNLDLNKLLRGVWLRGNEPLTIGFQWTSNRQGILANALLTLQKDAEDRGSLRVVLIGKLEQRLDLIAEPRHFGGRQWYFLCPVTDERCSVVWLPPGADRFCSRQAWGKQVAYSTQFEEPFNRAIAAREKVKDRLIGELNRSEWELPPKPKWMRWHTYACLADKYCFQQRKIDRVMADYLAKSLPTV